VSSTFEFVSADGTRLRGWSNDQAGVPLVIANGLGTTPEAWPALLEPDCGYAAVSWYQRGTFGSERPADPSRVRVEDHVEDLVALLDARGLDRVLVTSWSMGVNMAFELALLQPDRVAGILAVAGVPGGTFATMGGPLRVPRRLRHPLSVRIARGGRFLAPAITRLTAHLPVGDRLAWVLTHSGAMTSAATPEVLVPMLEQFVRHDWSWYLRLAVGASEHPPMDLTFVDFPVTLVAGTHDVLTSMQDVVACGRALRHAQVTVLQGSHFLPLEYPTELRSSLDDLAVLAGLTA
jgi:pimeloyl-ACP methyl ester carboxylesterase